MIEWPLVFVSGLLGSSHCIGMCGGFAWLVSSGAGGSREGLRRQLAFTLGRVFTYACLGATAGFLGHRLLAAVPSWARWQAGLAIGAGLLLIGLGIQILRGRANRSSGSGTSCLASSFYSEFLKRPGWGGAFLAGLFTGWLPCGLVYATLSLAASTASVGGGAFTMALFGAGTAPALILFGVGSQWLSHAARRRVFQVAALCIIVTGTVSIVRGATAWRTADQETGPACPACAAE